MTKASRYAWPADKHDRIAQIIANLRVYIPRGEVKGRKGRPTKDEEEDDYETEQ